MSVVSTVVFLSQSLRVMANRMHSKAINAMEKRIKQVEAEQVKCEAHRSKMMVNCHNKHYAAKAAATTKFNEEMAALKKKHFARIDKLDTAFEQNRRTIALTSQASSNELKRELAMLGSELDHLTK
ncbi:polysaccharide chain length determinant protein [Lelliottia phage phD2B]|uniref:Uncharacterized protein n=1 Tax=Lelliottia phage phD2B TaxID=1542498 RepID=A0A088FS27_9CAUD|nr:polysaccharide chain length determinant protein [Lelliottia phage phD2B]AIM51243.1 hypothetical protein phD2B_0016 [Lelliottia phage phD2B]